MSEGTKPMGSDDPKTERDLLRALQDSLDLARADRKDRTAREALSDRIADALYDVDDFDGMVGITAAADVLAELLLSGGLADVLPPEACGMTEHVDPDGFVTMASGDFVRGWRPGSVDPAGMFPTTEPWVRLFRRREET